MMRPNPILQVYVAEKLAANFVVAAHRIPHPEDIAGEIDNNSFNSLLVVPR